MHAVDKGIIGKKMDIHDTVEVCAVRGFDLLDIVVTERVGFVRIHTATDGGAGNECHKDNDLILFLSDDIARAHKSYQVVVCR